ncbi:MAG TPA: hypothetical protein VMI06_08835 [Terriglobia bacterium]|nr:hypothetical protein [Terriglobia bacterium]
MTLEGTIINGVIVLDGGARLPEGERVRIELMEDDDIFPPPEPYDREKELAILRESIEDMNAGRGRPFEEVMAEIAARYNLPPLKMRSASEALHERST